LRDRPDEPEDAMTRPTTPRLSYLLLALAALGLFVACGGPLAGDARTDATDVVDTLPPGGDYSGQDLTDADFSDQDLTEADFSDVEAPGASFTNAVLHGARLKGGNFRGADVRCADLSETHLAGADFSGADLRGATLDRSTQPGEAAKFTDAVYGVTTDRNGAVIDPFADIGIVCTTAHRVD
jgi:hypothetical protein